MAKTPTGFKEIRVLVPDACYTRLMELKDDAPVRTVQAMLAPVVNAFSLGQIQQQYVQIIKKM